MVEFRKVHQYNVFCVNAPMQHAIAAYLEDPAPWRDLPVFYQAKRDLFRAGLAKSRFTLLPSDGTYFQCVRYDAISDLGEAEFAEWLTREIKVAAMKRVIDLQSLPEEERYEPAAGFMMFMLRKVPKKTDSVEYEGVRFEVLDVDHHRIDQILVKRLDPGQKALGAAMPAAH